MRLIEGVVDERGADEQALLDAQDEIADLKNQLAQARLDVQKARHESERALAALRRQLTPLYRALQGVFGELDAAGVSDVGSGPSLPTTDPRVAAIWASWKTRLGGQCGKVIDALLLQPDMNTTQLAIAIGTRRQNIPGLIYKLNQAGLLTKNGGKFSLKAL
jgi:chromosome segregation ATPase